MTFMNMPENKEGVRELKKIAESISTFLMLLWYSRWHRMCVRGGETPCSFQLGSRCRLDRKVWVPSHELLRQRMSALSPVVIPKVAA